MTARDNLDQSVVNQDKLMLMNVLLNVKELLWSIEVSVRIRWKI